MQRFLFYYLCKMKYKLIFIIKYMDVFNYINHYILRNYYICKKSINYLGHRIYLKLPPTLIIKTCP